MARKFSPKNKEYDLFTILELKLIDIIMNPERSNKDMEFFKSKVISEQIDHDALYRIAIKYEQFQFADLIIQSGKFDINKESYFEIIGYILWGNDSRILRFIQDGYCPNRTDLEHIFDIYTKANDIEHDMQVYNHFANLYKSMNN